MYSALAKKAAQDKASNVAYGLAMSAPSVEEYRKSLSPQKMADTNDYHKPMVTATPTYDTPLSPLYSDAQMAKDYQAYKNKVTPADATARDEFYTKMNTLDNSARHSTEYTDAIRNNMQAREWDSLNSELHTEALNTPTPLTADQKYQNMLNTAAETDSDWSFGSEARGLGMGETTLGTDKAGLGTRDKWEIGLGVAQLGLGMWGARNAAKGMRDSLRTSAQNRRINQEMWDSKKDSKTALSKGLAAVRSTRQGA
jgi:hypothetical protein